MLPSTVSKKSIEQLIVETILNYSQPYRIILFGSRARGDAESRADYDIAVDDQKLTRLKLARIRADLELLPTLHEIDLVWLNRVAENFRRRILEEGKILYEQKN